MKDVAAIVTPREGGSDFLKNVSVGAPTYSPGDIGLEWDGGMSDRWNSELVTMLSWFKQMFVSPEDAGLPIDGEEHWYAEVVPILDTPEAVREAFEYLNDDVRKEIEDHLSRYESCYWCRTYDIDHVHE